MQNTVAANTAPRLPDVAVARPDQRLTALGNMRPPPTSSVQHIPTRNNPTEFRNSRRLYSPRWLWDTSGPQIVVPWEEREDVQNHIQSDHRINWANENGGPGRGKFRRPLERVPLADRLSVIPPQKSNTPHRGSRPELAVPPCAWAEAGYELSVYENPGMNYLQQGRWEISRGSVPEKTFACSSSVGERERFPYPFGSTVNKKRCEEAFPHLNRTSS